VKVFGYLRISTVEQGRGYGLEAQEVAITEYCIKEGLPAPEFISEQGSGESMFKRPKLLSLLSMAEDLVESGEGAMIVFYKLDRLSRDQIELEATIVKSFRTGVQFRSTDMFEADLLTPEYQDDPMRVAMRQIVGVFAQLERKIIQARLAGGLAVKASKGGFTGGKPPLGYMVVEKELRIDPEVAPVIRRVFRLKKAQVANTTILAVCARDFPPCIKWHKSYISRILQKEDLYCRGLYRPRGGDVTFTLPNLIIVHDGDDGEFEQVETGEIKWEAVSDPIKMDALSLLIEAEPGRIKKLALEHSIPIAWHGSKTAVPKDIAIRLYELSKEQP
jgi:DNA invertase Pin-like site-specific DNA recombinase